MRQIRSAKNLDEIKPVVWSGPKNKPNFRLARPGVARGPAASCFSSNAELYEAVPLSQPATFDQQLRTQEQVTMPALLLPWHFADVVHNDQGLQSARGTWRVDG